MTVTAEINENNNNAQKFVIKTNSNKAKQTITGVVEHIFFSSSKFCAGKLRDDDDNLVRFAGPFVVSENERIKINGTWKNHKTYGSQFQVNNFTYDRPVDKKGLAVYLSKNPLFKGIGQVKAKIIADEFGDDFENHLNKSPDKIAEKAKIPLGTVKFIKSEWKRTKTFNQTMTWLYAFELSNHQVDKIIKKLGNNAVAVLRDNPYMLTGELSGFGFKKIDKIARQIGIDKDKSERIRAGILYCIDEAIQYGHTWIELQDLIKQAEILLILDNEDAYSIIQSEIDYLLKYKELKSVYMDRELIARPWIYNMEKDLHNIFTLGVFENPHCNKLEEALITVLVKANLNKEQTRAFEIAVKHKISLISGGAGSGKTYLSNTIRQVYEAAGLKTVLCAPTGKAAKRLEQMSAGTEAFTIHRLLGFKNNDFVRGPDCPIDADVILIDEASMIDVPLAWHLFRAVDLSKTAIVIIGDHNQLPPVGCGNILRDLINSSILPAVKLNSIVRQAGVLKENCISLLEGKVQPTPKAKLTDIKPWYVISKSSDVQSARDFVLMLYSKILPYRYKLDVINDVQLLTPTRKGPLGVNSLNIELQRLIQKTKYYVDIEPVEPGRKPRFYVYDKIIQRKNNYKLGIMNGSIGRIISIDKRTNNITAEFDDREVILEYEEGNTRHIELAYALTIHQAQGSEFPAVVNIIHKSHSFMHHRNLLYTGSTRARKTNIIIGDVLGIGNCARKQEVDRRRTFLSFLCRGVDL